MGLRVAVLISVVASVASIGCGCNRDSGEVPPLSVTQSVLPQGADLSYEDIGRLHNEALAYLESNGAGPKTDSETFDLLLTDFLTSRGIRPTPGQVDTARDRQFIETYLNSTPSSAVTMMQADGLISQAQLGYMQDLIRNVTQLSTMPAADIRIRDYVAGVEREVSANTRLSPSEQSQLLTSLAIVRHSSAYWYAKSLEQGAARNGLSKACKACLAARWGWIALYDGFGGLAGGILFWATAPLVSFIAVFIVCPVCG